MPITVGGVTRNLEFSQSDLADASNQFDDRRQEILYRLIIAVKEAGAVNITQIRTAINNKTFSV
jgi:hypothetical protein